VPVPQLADLELVKEAAVADNAQGLAGETVTYSFTATNTGNVTLSGVAIEDAKEGLYGFAYGEWPGAEGVLAPGESVTATASYDLTQADVDSGAVRNTATATGTPPGGEEVADEDTVDVPVTAAPAITLVKSGALAADARGVVGDLVTFTIRATNTGNVTLSGVAITDPMPGLSALVHDWSGAAAEGVLAPGESVTATATYALTQADLDAGRVANTASVVGTPPGGDVLDVTDEAGAEVTIVPAPPAAPLPSTGTDVAPALAVVLGLLLVGAVAVRRRTTA
jgi:uncharacterized repeat protein (TIGR01451 family)